jgi:hypothetical protein
MHAEGIIDQQELPSITCFTGGDFRTCQPLWANGGSWNKNSKTSFFQISPTASLYVQLALSSGGGFFIPVSADTVTHLWATSPAYVYKTCTLGIFCNSYTDYAVVNHNWELVNASGVTFNWSTEFRWSCTYTACNTP